jgi:glutamyl-tRNA reductase
MNIVMSGVDHTMADVKQRECFALSKEEQGALLRKMKGNPEILGAVLLSTCNRTELYLSFEEGVQLNPFTLCFEGREEGEYQTLKGREAFDHLASLSCGVLSRIYGEEQILTQVKGAIGFAREQKAADSILEVFFRIAVTTAKRIRTDVRFRSADASVSHAARDILKRHADAEKILVIGNGMVGRQTAEVLAEAGYQVTMTLRQYRNSTVRFPKQVSTVEYDCRYEVLEQYDAVVSATASPHCTISARRLKECPKIPHVYIDLAMPRDIEPEVGTFPSVTLYNIDQVADGAAREQEKQEQMEQIAPMIQRGYEEWLKWNTGRLKSLEQEPKTHFPLFIDSTGKTALVVGGGTIAARRIKSLCRFSFLINVVAPEAKEEILQLAESGRIQYECRKVQDIDLADIFMVVAATNDREVNHHIAMQAKHRGIYASIADKREECSFYFPAIAENETVTAGVCGDGVAHQNVSAAAKKIREVLTE